MACRKTKQRTYHRRTGWLRAAAELGVDYSHLRRVLIGDRPGKSLLRRYREFKKTGIATAASAAKGPHLNSPKLTPPPFNVAGAENLSPAFFAVLEALGYNVVVVRFTWGDKPTIMAALLCEEHLGALLEAAHVGSYDSTYYDTGSLMHFFHAGDLAKAMQILKDAIAERGLLDRATILHAEENTRLRVWYPPTAGEVNG